MRALAAVGAAAAFALALAHADRTTPAAVERHAAGHAASARLGAVDGWQLHATHADEVPGSVLRAAAAVKIAVIDTGADLSVPDLAARSPETWNTRTGSSDVRDVNGHGTFVASLAAAESGEAQLLVIKSGSDGGSFTDDDEAAGIDYAVEHGARVINLSIGGQATSQTEQRAVQDAVAHGVLIVTAVGNERQSGDPVEYPAALLQPVGSNGVGGAGLAVTASTSDGRRAPFANTGSWVSLAAPGDHVLGALSAASSPLMFPRATLPGLPTGLYGYGSGTSFAAPLVAGAAALVWAANPSLTAQQVAQLLKATASGHGTWTSELGFGVIDVAAAVAEAQQGASGVLLSGARDKLRVKLDWSGTASAYTLVLTRDGRAPRTVVRSTTHTSTTLRVAKGHTYSFVVDALDANGTAVAVSTPVTFTIR